MRFSSTVFNIKSKFTKKHLKVFDEIECFESVHLSSMGSNDEEGYQIFTPEFIVKEMVEAVGCGILDINKNVLEPTSGDGAFTTYILKKRLEKLLCSNDFEIESLKALSTIYSIEMDKELIIKQRNNIYTLINLFINENKIFVSKSYFELVKCIICTNFIWAMFNSDNDLSGLFVEVAYRMPEAAKGNLKSMEMPVWNIDGNNISLTYEGVDIW